MKKLSVQDYHELRNKIWEDLTSSGVSSDEDENFKAFDGVLGNQLPVDWNWDETQGSDICYGCGTAQNYKTMKDIDETFAIYCDPCHNKQTEKLRIIEAIEELEDVLDTNSGRTDWTDDEVSMEMDWLYGKVNKIKKDLESNK